MDTEYLSPDGRHTVQIYPCEMRMSPWVESPTLLDCRTKEKLFDGPSLWSADTIEWSPESDSVRLSLRVYPGDKPSVTVWLYPLTGRVKAQPDTISSPEIEGCMADIERYLEGYGRP
ncbi:MAG: hypothetical protein ABIO24_14405 [Saprospiraceae bacterium]